MAMKLVFLAALVYATLGDLFKTLLRHAGPTKVPASKGRALKIGEVTIAETMRVRFKVNVLSFPKDGWRGIMRIGPMNTYYPRLPGVWIYKQPNPRHPGLHISLSNDESLNPWIQVPTVSKTGKQYRVEIEWNDDEFEVRLNGKQVLFRNVPEMSKYIGKRYPVTIGDNMFNGVNCIVSDFEVAQMREHKQLLGWDNDGPVAQPIANLPIGHVKIAPAMRVIFSLIVNKWPTDTWRGVLRVGPENAHYPRLPGFWLYPQRDARFNGLHVSVSNDRELNPWSNVREVNRINTEYQIELIWTPNMYQVSVNGKLVLTRKTHAMTKYIGKKYPVFIGAPKFNPVNGLVKYLEIDRLDWKKHGCRSSAKANNLLNSVEINNKYPYYYYIAFGSIVGLIGGLFLAVALMLCLRKCLSAKSKKQKYTYIDSESEGASSSQES